MKSNISKSNKSTKKCSSSIIKKSKVSECPKAPNCLKMYDYMIL